MQSVEYCEDTWVRLTSWKAQLFDVVQVAEHFHSPGKKVIEPELRKLMITINEIGNRLNEYRKLCKDTGTEARRQEAVQTQKK